jgi:phenylacetate-CoA ligase
MNDNPKHPISALSLKLVDLVKKTDSVHTYHELSGSQWLPQPQLEELQFSRTRALLIHAFENVPYYRALFGETGFDPRRFRDMSDLGVLPVLTKKIIRENFDGLMASNAGRYGPRRRQTSGSTGQPLVFFASKHSHGCTWANNWRAFSAAGFRLGDPFAILTGGALMPNTTPFRQKVYTVLMGMKQLPAYHLSPDVMDGYTEFLRTNRKYGYLYAYPSAVYLLARHILKIGDVGRTAIRAVFTTSEVLSPDQRAVIEQAFGCPVFDTYGNNETSLYAFECDRHDGLHYSMEHSFLEVLTPDGKPCAPGESGRFIATNLFNYAMPLIRYDTGDLGALAGDGCPCGRGLKRIADIMGRSRDFVRTPDGRRIHGAFFNHFEPFYRTPWIAAWHIRQDRIDHLTISLRPDGPPVRRDMDLIHNLLKKALGEDMNIEFVMDDRLHVTPAGKLKLIECCLDEETAPSA